MSNAQSVRVTRPGALPMWKDRSRHVPTGDYLCVDGDEDTIIMNAADGTTFRVEDLEFQQAIEQGTAEVLARKRFVSDRRRTVVPDPATNPAEPQYEVIDIEQGERFRGRRYHAGTIIPLPAGGYCVVVPLLSATAAKPAHPAQTFRSIEEARDWLPEAVEVSIGA